MNPVSQLIAFGLRQVIGDTADPVLQAVESYCTDHGKALPEALAKANDRAWQALAVALAGDGWLDSVRVFFASGDDKGMREQVRRFLASNPIAFGSAPAEFRRACLADLQKARKAGVLAADRLDDGAVAQQAADFRRYTDGDGLLDGARRATAAVADALAADYPNLAKLLREPTPGGPPLLAAAFGFFFRREVETNDELARGLTFDGLRRLAARQEAAFGEVGAALEELGGRFDELLGQVLADLEHLIRVAEETRQRVEDLQAQFARLREDIRQAATRNDVRAGRMSPRVNVTTNNAQEQDRLRLLWGLYKKVPAELHKADDLMLLGDTLEAAALFDEAQQCYEAASRAARAKDQAQEAEANFKAYRDACERDKWDEALRLLRRAAELDPKRFEPFPLKRYEPVRILGAGGFGAAFLCRDHYFKDKEVVVKVLHTTDLARSVEDVFGEAHALIQLNHPSIIGVLDCNYADPEGMARPYIVMHHFPGVSLEAFVKDAGPLAPGDLLVVAEQIAQGMKAAHARDVLHRDLSPDNVLVLKQDGRWQVKVIDFGLARTQQAVETSLARAAQETILGREVSGKIRYSPPEQMGQLKDGKGRPVPVGKYSDVFTFGKLCCFALFKTTEPKDRHWSSSPQHGQLKMVLERCADEEVEHRLPSFEAVLGAIDDLGAERQGEKRRQEQERAERQRREEAAREAERLRQEREKEEQRRRQQQEEAERRDRELTLQRQEEAQKAAERLRAERAREEKTRRRKEVMAWWFRAAAWCALVGGVLLVCTALGAVAIGGLGALLGVAGANGGRRGISLLATGYGYVGIMAVTLAIVLIVTKGKGGGSAGCNGASIMILATSVLLIMLCAGVFESGAPFDCTTQFEVVGGAIGAVVGLIAGIVLCVVLVRKWRDG